MITHSSEGYFFVGMAKTVSKKHQKNIFAFFENTQLGNIFPSRSYIPLKWKIDLSSRLEVCGIMLEAYQALGSSSMRSQTQSFSAS
jgi:hypothetical protein